LQKNVKKDIDVWLLLLVPTSIGLKLQTWLEIAKAQKGEALIRGNTSKNSFKKL
jgi:hypothetical protein